MKFKDYCQLNELAPAAAARVATPVLVSSIESLPAALSILSTMGLVSTYRDVSGKLRINKIHNELQARKLFELYKAKGHEATAAYIKSTPAYQNDMTTHANKEDHITNVMTNWMQRLQLRDAKVLTNAEYKSLAHQRQKLEIKYRKGEINGSEYSNALDDATTNAIQASSNELIGNKVFPKVEVPKPKITSLPPAHDEIHSIQTRTRPNIELNPDEITTTISDPNTIASPSPIKMPIPDVQSISRKLEDIVPNWQRKPLPPVKSPVNNVRMELPDIPKVPVDKETSSPDEIKKSFPWWAVLALGGSAFAVGLYRDYKRKKEKEGEEAAQEELQATIQKAEEEKGVYSDLPYKRVPSYDIAELGEGLSFKEWSTYSHK